MNEISEVTNGTLFRSLINDEEIKYERSVAFEPDEIKITIYTNYGNYQKWLTRKRETVNFKITNTNINLTLIIQHVVLYVALEEVVQVVLHLWSEQKLKEHNHFINS
jgi:hypothetical protein